MIKQDLQRIVGVSKELKDLSRDDRVEVEYYGRIDPLMLLDFGTNPRIPTTRMGYFQYVNKKYLAMRDNLILTLPPPTPDTGKLRKIRLDRIISITELISPNSE